METDYERVVAAEGPSERPRRAVQEDVVRGCGAAGGAAAEGEVVGAEEPPDGVAVRGWGHGDGSVIGELVRLVGVVRDGGWGVSPWRA